MVTICVYTDSVCFGSVTRNRENSDINIRKQSAAKFSAEVYGGILPETLHGYISQRFAWIYFPQIRMDLFLTDSHGFISHRFAWIYLPKIRMEIFPKDFYSRTACNAD